jgi:HlyD family secretion protein
VSDRDDIGPNDQNRLIYFDRFLTSAGSVGRAAEASLRQADAALHLARNTAERQTRLGATGVASPQAIDQAQADLDAASAKRTLLAEQLALLTAPPRPEDVAIAQANLAIAQAHVAEVAANLEKTIIRSPIEGVVLRRFRRTGETVTTLPPTPILSVGDVRRLRVRAAVDEADVARIAVGQSAWITADAYGSRRFRGKVVRIAAALGRKTIRTDEPAERFDEKVLDALIDLDAGQRLPVGLRVDVVFEPPPGTQDSLVSN